MKTYSPKPEHIERSWYVVDASGQVLGRLASEVATLLRGKHKPIFAPHMDTGDHVVVINADKVELSGNKAQNKFAYRHSGYPGGIKGVRYADLLATRPVAAELRVDERPRKCRDDTDNRPPSASARAEGASISGRRQWAGWPLTFPGDRAHSGAGGGGAPQHEGTRPEIRRPEVACEEARGGEGCSQEGAGGLRREEVCRIEDVGEEADRQEACGDHVSREEADRQEDDREEVRGEETREDGGVICRWP